MSGLSAAPYRGPAEVHYLFVDAGSLRGRLKNISERFFGGVEFEVDFSKLAQEYTKTFYYDALPVQEDGEPEGEYRERIRPLKDTLDRAAGVDGLHVFEGDARRRRKVGLQQKKVDVMIAVDMLTHSFRRNMHKATLLTGDNDFKPLVDALVLDGMFLTLWYPPSETSRELLDAADARRPLDLAQLANLLTEPSRPKFDIPIATNRIPSEDPGMRVCEWTIGRVRHTLNRDGDDFLMLRDGNQLNRLHVRHKNFELLQTYCREVLGFEIPWTPDKTN